MLIVLSKCLPFLLLPLGFALLVLLAAFRWRRGVLIAGPALILWLLGTPLVADRVMESLEDRYPFQGLSNCPKADAAFVFGGMLSVRDRQGEGIAWNEAAERFERALLLYNMQRIQFLVLSGGSRRYGNLPDEGDHLKLEAIARGIPGSSIIVTQPAANTQEEANALCGLVQRNRWKRVLLVTSAFHMPRAMYLSRKCSAELIPVPVAYQTPGPGSWVYARPDYYVPRAKALAVSELALREYIGLFFYRIAGE
jgi:uncharacterized SAM-binding protein YcdF (DUF218 family)